ncbi:hypothetical protein [Catellatospora methionotrophica]|uniref:hypothetical protein n=1 Tax=Catellatospora methionotrophica TaxID=121620 RepID=UPI00340F1EC2
MHQAATTADVDPDRLSFTTTLRAVRRFIAHAATIAVLADAVRRAVAGILEDQHERRDRVSPRVVKRSQSPTHRRNTPPSQGLWPSATPSTSSVEARHDLP